MALTKNQKNELVDQYQEWLNTGKAVILTEHVGLTMKNLDKLRATLRETGGEFHIIKNTLCKRVFEKAGYPVEDRFFVGTTALGLSFEDVPGLAKAIADFAGSSDFLRIKGGYLGDKLVDENEIKALATLPPLPVLRAQLLSAILTPASQLARTVVEPARQVAAVVKAYAEKDSV